MTLRPKIGVPRTPQRLLDDEPIVLVSRRGVFDVDLHDRRRGNLELELGEAPMGRREPRVGARHDQHQPFRIGRGANQNHGRAATIEGNTRKKAVTPVDRQSP